uniref:Uncharacterized protein n=1 Tax=Romanomermis culicivorax TaxID=13658 RepID=A0A915HU14_ROMCU
MVSAATLVSILRFDKQATGAARTLIWFPWFVGARRGRTDYVVHHHIARWAMLYKKQCSNMEERSSEKVGKQKRIIVENSKFPDALLEQRLKDFGDHF